MELIVIQDMTNGKYLKTSKGGWVTDISHCKHFQNENNANDTIKVLFHPDKSCQELACSSETQDALMRRSNHPRVGIVVFEAAITPTKTTPVRWVEG